MTEERPPRLLTIAGSDSGGGAGIQADLKTFAAFGGYGMSAVTAVTAQNTVEVRAVQVMEPHVVKAQIAAVFDDIGVDALKIGMLADEGIVEAVVEALAGYPPLPIVLDPVMIAKSGARLLSPAAEAVLRERLLPRVTVVTPNLPEAATLLGWEQSALGDEGRRRQAARELGSVAGAALLKGGHAEGDELVDLLFDGERMHRFVHRRLASRSTHGTGCTLSAAVAAGLGRGWGLAESVEAAIQYLQGAIEHAFPLGRGHGPVNHLFALRPVGR